MNKLSFRRAILWCVTLTSFLSTTVFADGCDDLIVTIRHFFVIVQLIQKDKSDYFGTYETINQILDETNVTECPERTDNPSRNFFQFIRP